MADLSQAHPVTIPEGLAAPADASGYLLVGIALMSTVGAIALWRWLRQRPPKPPSLTQLLAREPLDLDAIDTWLRDPKCESQLPLALVEQFRVLRYLPPDRQPEALRDWRASLSDSPAIS